MRINYQIFILILLSINTLSQVINLRKAIIPENDDIKAHNTLLNFNKHFQYYAQFQLGSQLSSVYLIINTRQADNWIFERKGHYIAGSSQTSVIYDSQNKVENYPIGTLNGNIIGDALSIRDLNIASVMVNFTLADPKQSVDMEFIVAQGYDGSLGLTYNSRGIKDFLDLAKEKGQITNSQFGLSLNDEPKFFVGEEFFPEVKSSSWYQILEDEWEIKLSKTVIGASEYKQLVSTFGIIDPNSNIITLESYTYQQFKNSAIIQQHCSIENIETDGLICECSETDYQIYPVIKFIAIDKAGKESELIINPKDYLFKTSEESNYCYLSIYEAAEDDTVLVFGQNLLKNYFLTFDKENHELGVHIP